MALRNEVLKSIKENPIEIREILSDSEIAAKLSSIGVVPTVFEMHEPSLKSRKCDGRGPTICGRIGTRHKIVTCKFCIKKIGK